MTITSQQLFALLPIFIVALTIILVMLSIACKRSLIISAVLSISGLLLALFSIFFIEIGSIQITPLLKMDHFSYFYMLLVLIASIASCIFAYPWLTDYPDNKEEFYLLMVIATLGGSVLACATHLASLFIGIELLSLPLFGLIGYAHRRKRSLEAAIKYMVLSAVASSFLIFGMALLYATNGGLSFTEIGDPYNQSTSLQPVMLAGFVFLLIGFSFKLSLVPFQLWTPDVYEGAPAPVSTYLSTVGKIAVFAVLIRLFIYSPASDSQALYLLLSFLAACSILFGNALALRQTNLKRMLGYSSIAHLGYLFIAFIALSHVGMGSFEAINLYLVGYLFSNLGAFGVICQLSSPYADEYIDTTASYRGLFWRKPILAICLAIMMLSLAGIPLTLGFIGKFYLLFAAVMTEQWWLIAMVIIGSAMGLYYYLRVAVMLFYIEHQEAIKVAARNNNTLATAVIFISTLIILFMGIYPQPLIKLAQLAVLVA